MRRARLARAGPLLSPVAARRRQSGRKARAVEAFALGLPPQPDDNALYEAMYAPPCGLAIGPSLGLPEGRAATSSTALTGRAPVTRAQIHPYITAH